MKSALVSLLFLSGALYAAPQGNATTQQLSDQIEQLKRLVQARGVAQINLQQQITDLQDELSQIRGETETHAHKLEQIIDRQRELYIEIERRLSNLQAQPAPQATPEVVEETSTQEYSGSLSENESYDQAVNLILKERRYDDAIPQFEKFIQQFPNSVFIPNAHYWLGQLLFNKSQFTEAQQHFNQVIRFYPDSSKRPDALLKQGTVLQKLGDEQEAKKLFEQVISEYPDSTSATLAKSRLSNIN
jgi:tol-pal system protein YbgF